MSRAYELADYEPVLEAASELGGQAILVGGQAVYFWAMRYSDRHPELDAFRPYTSKNADFLADAAAGRALARHLNTQFNPSPTKGGMLGLCIGDIPLGEEMKVEILGRINGVKIEEIQAATLRTGWRDIKIYVIHPAQLFVAKGCNVVDLDQSGRQDAKHFAIMRWVLRGFLYDVAHGAGEEAPRAFLKTCEYLMDFAVSHKGTKLIEQERMPATGLWPDLKDHPDARIRRFVAERVPRWEGKVAALVERRCQRHRDAAQ